MSALNKTASFGQLIRDLRRKQMLPLRKVAAELDLDPSTLGKIEKNTRRPSPEHIMQLARIFKYPEEELLIQYYSDMIASQISSFTYAERILHATEKKIVQLKNSL